MQPENWDLPSSASHCRCDVSELGTTCAIFCLTIWLHSAHSLRTWVKLNFKIVDHFGREISKQEYSSCSVVDLLHLSKSTVKHSGKFLTKSIQKEAQFIEKENILSKFVWTRGTGWKRGFGCEREEPTLLWRNGRHISTASVCHESLQLVRMQTYLMS